MELKIDYNNLTQKEKQFLQSIILKSVATKKSLRNRIFGKPLAYLLLFVFTVFLLRFYYTFDGPERYLGIFAFAIIALCWRRD